MSNQYKDFVAYDSSEPINQLQTIVMDKTSVAEHVMMLKARTMPESLMVNTMVNSSFRDAVLHQLVDSNATALDVFIQGVKSCADDAPNLVRYAEYAAALAYAQGQAELAKAIVLRIPPTTTSSLIKNIAVGLSNGMSSDSFKELLRNSTAMSASLLA